MDGVDYATVVEERDIPKVKCDASWTDLCAKTHAGGQYTPLGSAKTKPMLSFPFSTPLVQMQEKTKKNAQACANKNELIKTWPVVSE